jgi:hypothetical protein
VNCIAPAIIRTDLYNFMPDDVRDAIVGGYPLGRVGEVEDVVATALFLATDDGSFFTGQTLLPAATSWLPDVRSGSRRRIPAFCPEIGDTSMIVEERCYTVKPGTVQLYYRDYDPRGLEIQTRILGNLIGYFHTEIGELNQIVHLWGYDSLAERERRRALLAADLEWQDYLKQSPDIIVKMESRILVPAPFSPIR